MLRRGLFLLIITAGVYVLFNLGRHTLSLWSAGRRIQDAGERVLALKTSNEHLRQNLSYYRSEEFVEREARNKLNLVRPGEVVVLLPSPSPQLKVQSVESVSNWRKWWRLFFD